MRHPDMAGLTDAMPLIVWTARPDGQVDYFNERWFAYTGLTWDETEGDRWHQAMHPDDSAAVLGRWHSALQTGETHEVECRFRRADGVYRWHLGRAWPTRDAAGQIVSWVGTATDIDDHKQLELQLREERETIETINRIGRVLSAELDLQKLVQAVTDAATELTGAQFGSFFYNLIDERGESYTLYTLSGAPRSAFANYPMPRNTHLFGPTFRGKAVIRLDDVHQDPRYGQNPPYHGMPASHLPVTSYLAVPVVSRSGEVLGGLFFGHEQPGVFTERVEQIVVGLAAQTAIAMDNAHLYQQARQAIQIREDFLSIASHELKTPVTGLRLQIQLLQRTLIDERLPANRRIDLINRVERQTRQLTHLIDTLLDTSQLAAGRLELHLQEVDLGIVVRHVAEAFEAELTAFGCPLTVEAADGICGHWDQGRVEQLVTNLLNNAMKYGRGKPIQITITRQDDLAHLTIRDEGIGIAAEYLPRIFDRFERAVSVQNYGGFGLGLYIVRRIVDSLDGTIKVASAPGAGTTFQVSLPLRGPGGDKNAPAAQEP